MKVRSFLPLVVTVIVGGGWLILQRQTISSVEKETVLWRKRVDAAKQAIQKTPTPTTAPAKVAVETDYQTYDWGKLLVMLGENHDFGKDAAFHKKLRTLSQEEITTALDEISRLDVPETSRKKLSQLFLGFFAFKYPEMALSRFKGSPASHNAEMNEYLAKALIFLAKKDPAKACAWLDDKIVSGEFTVTSLSGGNGYRSAYEKALCRVLFPSDPATVEKRLIAMSETEAAWILTDMISADHNKSNPIPVAKLMRKALPENRVAEIISYHSHPTGWLSLRRKAGWC